MFLLLLEWIPILADSDRRLEIFYLTDFKLLPTKTEAKDSETTAYPSLDPILAVLGCCQSLAQVNIERMEHIAFTSVWPLFQSTPNIADVTLRGLDLPSSALPFENDDLLAHTVAPFAACMSTQLVTTVVPVSSGCCIIWNCRGALRCGTSILNVHLQLTWAPHCEKQCPCSWNQHQRWFWKN